MRESLMLGFKLFLIAAIAGILLGATNQITKAPIKNQEVLAAEAARKEVLPSADVFESINNVTEVEEAYVGKDADGNAVGFVAKVTVKGYGGSIEIVIGVDMNACITGVNIGGSSFAETAGLGAKAKDPEFAAQFIGKVQNILLETASKPQPGENKVDAITAATITSTAVTKGVNSALDYLTTLAATYANGGNS